MFDLKKIFKKIKSMQTEVITNSNGTAVKYPDGSMICYKEVWTQGNNEYETINLPEKFIDNKYQVCLTNNYNNSKSLIWTVGTKTTSSFRAYPLFASTSATPTMYSSANCIVIGRWK